MDASRWHRPPEEELRRRLTPLQWAVTQEGATEPPFHNPYWDEHRPGLYVDVASGEPLFSSRDKFESGTGWPSFARPVAQGRVVLRPDLSHGMRRVEVLSRIARSHLGHLFEDGQSPSGLRYCINSAALRLVPVEVMAAEGYGDWLSAVLPDGEAGPGGGPEGR